MNFDTCANSPLFNIADVLVTVLVGSSINLISRFSGHITIALVKISNTDMFIVEPKFFHLSRVYSRAPYI